MLQNRMHDTTELARWILNANTMVAFTGAGISTESGIPDFRSPGGIWAQSQPVYFDQFLTDASARYEYWRQKAIAHRDFFDSTPNVGHQLLATWEQEGRLQGVITQNIDGLHQLAGSEQVVELHGTARQIACLDCESRFGAASLVEQFLAEDAVPACPDCEGRLKHATISFGQALDPRVMEMATAWTQEAELYLAMGSSLVVQPAATLPQLAKQMGSKLVIINRDATPLDALADMVIHAPIGETLRQVQKAMTRVT
ncbi:MAG TPA: hypothetical protein DCY79_11040 [Planctomycetaceae bacterium]|nr:hypothetical protein [Blastopirellula sp.]HAY80331.1 hypothetical protein [Planctomycetaceae bacterium]